MGHLSSKMIFAVRSKYTYLERRKKGNATMNLNFLEMLTYLCEKEAHEDFKRYKGVQKYAI